MKRMIPIITLSVLLLAAVDANAVCWNCRDFPEGSFCVTVFAGALWCDDSSGNCILSEEFCPGLVAAAESPLATELTVASVERLDHPSTQLTSLRISGSTEKNDTSLQARIVRN